jgi:hypothetical protein
MVMGLEEPGTKNDCACGAAATYPKPEKEFVGAFIIYLRNMPITSD